MVAAFLAACGSGETATPAPASNSATSVRTTPVSQSKLGTYTLKSTVTEYSHALPFVPYSTAQLYSDGVVGDYELKIKDAYLEKSNTRGNIWVLRYEYAFTGTALSGNVTLAWGNDPTERREYLYEVNDPLQLLLTSTPPDGGPGNLTTTTTIADYYRNVEIWEKTSDSY